MKNTQKCCRPTKNIKRSFSSVIAAPLQDLALIFHCLIANKDLGNEAGNIFVIEGLPNQVAPNIRWISDLQLNIQRNLTSTERLAQTSWGVSSQIKVVYGSDGSE